MSAKKVGKQKISSKSISRMALTVPVGGYIHAQVNSVALPDNGMPPHTQLLDQTWEIPLGAHNYGNANDGAIVTQGYPSNGGSHSWEYLRSVCTVRNQEQNPPTAQLNLTMISDLDSGVGRGTGASSDFDAEWFFLANLPAGKPWTLTVISVVNGSGVTPTCSVRVNGDKPRPVSTGPSVQTFANLSGTAAVFFKVSQGHLAIFPNGPTHGVARPTINSDITLSFTRV